MVSVMLLLAHPRSNSFNHAIAERVAAGVVRAGAHLMFHDLHAEGFDPIVRTEESSPLQPVTDAAAAVVDPLLQQHRDELAAADALVVVHPNWWHRMPAHDHSVLVIDTHKHVYIAVILDGLGR